MSLNISGEKCAVCKAYLFAEDDVVYCPECGAPHHRDCYNAISHCALDEFHGTENQYKKPEPPKQENAQPVQNITVKCGMCDYEYDITEEFCPECNTPNVARAGGRFIAFDFLGGVPADMDLGDGVTANEAKKFVVNNTHRYIPKFAGFKSGKKASWNWLAFFAPCGWFLSRKMYVWGSVIGALQIAFTMLSAPFYKAISYLDFSEAANYIERSNIITENIATIGVVAVVTAFIGVLLNFVLKIVSAVIGDLVYNKRVINTITEIKTKSEHKDEDFRKKGGINLVAGLSGIIAVEYLPSIIATLTGLL